MDPLSVTAGVAGVLSTFASLAAALRVFEKAKHKAARKKRNKTAANSYLGLRIVHTPPSAPDFDICFVHGLIEDARSSWTVSDAKTKEEVFWPRDLLCKTFPRARILSYGYETDVNSLCWLAERTLYHHASHLLNDLGESRESCSDRPLLFVAHSLGGLLVKSALIFASDDVNSHLTAERQIYLSTFGIVSFDSPHIFTGKTPGKLSLSDIIGQLCGLSEQTMTSNDPRTLPFEDAYSPSWRRDIETLRDRLQVYKSIAVEIPELFCYSSDLAARPSISARDIAVPPKRLMGCVHPLSDDLPIQADHSSICKFTTVANRDYAKLCNTIRQFLDESKTSLPERWGDFDKTEDSPTIPHGKIDKIRASGFVIPPQLKPRPQTFVSSSLPLSRDFYLDSIHKRVINERFSPITGLGGYGKTSLALEYAYRYGVDVGAGPSPFSSIFWLDGTSEKTLESGFTDIAERLQTHYLLDESLVVHTTAQSTLKHSRPTQTLHRDQISRRPLDSRVATQDVLAWLSIPENNNWLLIYDDVDPEAPYLKNFCPTLGRGHIIMIGRRKDRSIEPRDIEAENALIPEGDYELQQASLDENLQSLPQMFGSSHADTTETSSPIKTQFSAPIRVGSFIRDESLDLLGRSDSYELRQIEPLSRCQTFNHIAEKVSDNPLDLAQVGAFLPLLSDPAQMTIVLDQDDKSINDVPQEYNQWIDLCVMLGPEHLPIILLELELEKNTAEIVEGLTELQKRSWVLIGDDSKTFQISQIRRRWRRRDLLGDQRVATCAQRACASVVALLEHTAKLPDSTSKSVEDLLLKHVDDCFDNLRRWGRLIDCEWDILARFCEKHGLHDKARVFYRANQSQRLNNSNTCSRHSISSMRSLSHEVSSEDWHEVENVDLEHEPEEIWYDTRSLGSSRRKSKNSDAIVDDIYALRDTKTSRALRSELGEIRMQIQLNDKASLEERCHKILDEVENRSEPRYVGLRNEALRGMMQIKLAQGEVLDSIQYGYRLAESLETALGPSAEETMNAIHELARLHMDQGDYMKAEPLLKQVLITYKRSWGHNHLKTMTVSQDLAEAYKGQGNATRSEALYHSIIEKYQEMWGLDHIRTAQAHEGLATVYDMVRDYKAADHHYKTALNAAKLLGTGNEEYKSMLQRRRLLQEKRK